MVDIPEQAVQAAASVLSKISKRETYHKDAMNILTAAAPYMSGVKVKQLEWSEVSEPNENIRYTHITANSPLGKWSIEWKSWKKYDDKTIFLDGNFISNGGDSLESATATAQADFERRVRECLVAEPVNVAAREQALEEAAQVICDGCRQGHPINSAGYHDRGFSTYPCHATAIRAHKSQPVSDGWLPIETAPKDGTDFIGWDGKWPFRCSAGKKYELYPHMDGGPTYRDVWDGHYHDSLTIEHPTHWRPIPPLPQTGGGDE